MWREVLVKEGSERRVLFRDWPRDALLQQPLPKREFVPQRAGGKPMAPKFGNQNACNRWSREERKKGAVREGVMVLEEGWH